MQKLQAVAQSPLGRLLLVMVGVGVVAYLVHQSGPALVWASITRSPAMFIVVFGMEFLVGATEAWGAVLLYGDARAKVTGRENLRIGWFCYSLIGVLPFGRAAGEAARAAMLAKYVGMPLAAASATRMQALSLLGNTVISVPCAVATFVVFGPSLLFAGVCVHFVVTGALGGGLLLAGKHSGLGAKVGRFFKTGASWGPEVDAHLKSGQSLTSPLLWVCISRVTRVVQRVTLLMAVGVPATMLTALSAESINLVASMIGDMIPGQMGLTEAGYSLAADKLGMTQSDGIAMALLVHIAQVMLIGLGFLTPLLLQREVPKEAPTS